MLMSSIGTKKVWCLFCTCSAILTFVLKKPTTHLTMHCFKCIFHMDNHIDLVGTVLFVEQIS